jgi:hypothetical protein
MDFSQQLAPITSRTLSFRPMQVRHFASSLEMRSEDVQQKQLQWEQATSVMQRLYNELSLLAQQVGQAHPPPTCRMP